MYVSKIITILVVRFHSEILFSICLVFLLFSNGVVVHVDNNVFAMFVRKQVI